MKIINPKVNNPNLSELSLDSKMLSEKGNCKINAAYESIDMHMGTPRENSTALRFLHGDNETHFTYSDLTLLSDKIAQQLTASCIQPSERIALLLPRSPALYAYFLGAVKAGASVMPLSPALNGESVAERIRLAGAKTLITTQKLMDALPEKMDLKQEIILDTDAATGDLDPNLLNTEPVVGAKKDLIQWRDKEDELLVFFNTRADGETAGYSCSHSILEPLKKTGQWVLDFKENDVYWCLSDLGWLSTTAYGIISPWTNGVCVVAREGRVSPDDWYDTIDRCRVTVCLTSSTVLRMLMAAGKERPGKYDLSSLRLLVNTGEPLKPEIIYWCMEHLGVPVHDAWCSEETGFQLICDFPGQPIKPGSMGRSVPGVQVEILDFLGRPLGPNAIGYLAVKRPWPAMPIQIYGHQEITPDKSMFKSWFVPGDLAYKDEDGYIWFQGKADVSSGLLNASEAFTIERKLAEHPSVEEACIAAAPGTQGQPMVKAFVSLAEEYAWTPRLQNELRLFLRENLPHCKLPDEFEVRSSLPMTRSGKIMRKVLSGSNKEDLVQVGF